jgi:16S rRNA (guanine527-N7)-methyltransferase
MDNNINEVLNTILEISNVPRETLGPLKEYVELLQKWNEKINLLRYNSSYELWYRHILDSAQLIKHISNDSKVMDLGSGGGLPGIVLSILGVKEIILVEADIRKCVFLNQASRLSPNKIAIENKRIEHLEQVNIDIITSRALSSIVNICSLIASFEINAKILLLKGKTVQEEINEALREWKFDYNLHKSVTSVDSFIVEIKNLKRRDND